VNGRHLILVICMSVWADVSRRGRSRAPRSQPARMQCLPVQQAGQHGAGAVPPRYQRRGRG